MAPNHRDNLAQHMHISSAEDLSYSVSPSSGINDTIQTIVTGRKCWKTMKGKGEVVWPPYLEAALVEGLEKYQPVESRTSRSFGRFPMRNKFISDYIFQVTGKRRTPKQVGSRLQQLRDTAEGKRILQQLSSRHMAMMQPKSAQSQSRPDAADTRPSTAGSSSSASASSSPTGSSSTPPARVPTSYVCIDVLPDPGTPPLRLPSLSFASSPLSPGAQPSSAIASFVPTPGSPTSPNSGMGLGLNSSGPRVLRQIDPAVTFMSRAALQAYSSFKVTKAGYAPGQAPIHTERTELELLSSSCMPMPQWSSEIECTFLYRTRFIPRFWDSLCRAADPSVYTVHQEIVRSGAADADQHAPEDVLLSIVYQFNNVTHTPPLSPDSPTFSSDASRPGTAGSHFSSGSTPEFGAELDDMMMFNSSLDVPHLPHSMHGSFSSSHPAHGAIDVKTPALIHADEDAYASLPPTPTSPFDLPPPGHGWASHQQHQSLAPPAQDCGRGMYGMANGMGPTMGGDIAIAGPGQYMNNFMSPYGM
ncbi:hypothetical protein DICSQDRAFT_183308 [Dichomitus squalens LYAD-421 SS1]|uniref:TEA domain-containing protein n=1 Tax=Dichomitus squalens (strain LYAD-421) TaxID=732165 RepID=R7SM87_DICSQ|nr:uncharacterized protein DICSQDRAFT_183308 [Dichomitus squalens LYAD-421 SS1]EJF57264.1 hypothetical protein DICSQDRAFT_183308 [Dichomitus squalens LYAD-421 SS1]